VGDSSTPVDGGSDATTDASDEKAPPADSGSDVTDSGTPSDASDAAATIDPSQLSGVVLWLNASAGVTLSGSNVSQWSDQSNHGNDAKPAGTAQSTVVNTQNNQPAIHFGSGAHLDIASSSSLQLGTGDFSLTIVMRANTPSDPNGGMVFAKQALPSPYLGLAVFMYLPSAGAMLGEVASQNGSWTWTSESTFNNNVTHIYGFRRVGQMIATRVDGVDDVPLTTDGGVDAGADLNCSNASPVHIGANVNGGQVFTGDINEIVLVTGTMKASDLTGLEAWFKQKYKL
jgi:hypothetical protein